MKPGMWGEKSEELTLIWISFPLSASRKQQGWLCPAEARGNNLQDLQDLDIQWR